MTPARAAATTCEGDDVVRLHIELPETNGDDGRQPAPLPYIAPRRAERYVSPDLLHGFTF